jgi:uncharacterized protein YecT (DUF1311 family)
MSPRRFLVPALISIGLSPPVSAGEPSAGCADAVGGPERAICLQKRLADAEADLAATYRAALAETATRGALSVPQRRDWRRALQEAQAKWLAFREADCGPPVGWERFGSAGMASAAAECRIAHSLARRDDLTARYGQKK